MLLQERVDHEVLNIPTGFCTEEKQLLEFGRCVDCAVEEAGDALGLQEGGGREVREDGFEEFGG